MKVFLCFVIVLLIALCAWIHFTATKPTGTHRAIISGLKAELEDSRAEFDAASETLDKAKAEIEELKQRLASLETVPTLEIRLSELKATFDVHHLSLGNRKALLESDLAALNSRRQSVADTELHFSEQSTRVDTDGIVFGNRGVRTSSADRERAKSKVADQVAEVDLEIVRKQAEISRVIGEMDSLRENYSKALVRLNGEFGVKSSPAFGN